MRNAKKKLKSQRSIESIEESSSDLRSKKGKKFKSNTYDDIRKKQLLEANEEEDKTIKRLEKMLKLNKKSKKKKIPSSFIDDGLDYLLEVIDSKDGERILSDDSLDLEEDLVAAKGVSTKLPQKRKHSVNSSQSPKKGRTLTQLLKERGELTESGESNCASDDENNLKSYDNDSTVENISDCYDDECDKNSSDGDNNPTVQDESGNDSADSDNDCEEENSVNTQEDVNAAKTKKPKLWEDIYGRLRDEHGNVVKGNHVTKELYVPPNLRQKYASISEQKQEELLKIKRQLKGLLNRLSESNMQPICHQIEEMYMKYSRNDMNETLFSLISELVFMPILMPPRLIMEQSMLVALLHANIGAEIGAFFLQHLVKKLDQLFKLSENYGEGKECNNVLTFLSHLYNFKVTHSTLIFDIFHHFIESFQNKDIELMQLFLKCIGFVLRKDDPLKLKEIILSIQAKAATVKKDQNDSRVSFMLDTLTAIRNNNIYKIPDYDPSIVEHSKKLLKGLIRKGCSVQELAISYEDLLKAEEKGRWWIVGSAWSDRDNITECTNSDGPAKFLPKTPVSEKILELAQKQHMNTEVRKSIFCIIMTAEDYMDAFEKLLKLNLKNQQEREIINVILHCALQEQNFNPYYAYLVGKFCSFARKYQISLQFSLWDKFKELSKMKARKISNLAHFLSHLFISGALPLSVLKVIHFSEMDKSMVRFFRQILLAILLHESEETCVQVFKRISAAKNLNLLREGLRLFMYHFVLRNQSKLETEIAEKLSERVKLAENALNSAKNAFKL